MRARACVVALSLLALPAAIAAQSAYRGQLDLTFVVRDRGVASATSRRYALDLALTIGGRGEARLAVRGTLDSTTSTMAPPGPPARGDTVHLDVDVVHEGRVIARDPRGFTVELREHGPWRCDSDGRDTWRCALTTPHRGFAWDDRAPAYLRAPMVLASPGTVRAEVHADAERVWSVEVRPSR